MPDWQSSYLYPSLISFLYPIVSTPIYDRFSFHIHTRKSILPSIPDSHLSSVPDISSSQLYPYFVSNFNAPIFSLFLLIFHLYAFLPLRLLSCWWTKSALTLLALGLLTGMYFKFDKALLRSQLCEMGVVLICNCVSSFSPCCSLIF